MHFPSRPATHKRTEAGPEERCHEFAPECARRPAEGKSAQNGSHKDAELGHDTPMSERDTGVKLIVASVGGQFEGIVIAKGGRIT